MNITCVPAGRDRRTMRFKVFQAVAGEMCAEETNKG
jgi:hypothetical protein